MLKVLLTPLLIFVFTALSFAQSNQIMGKVTDINSGKAMQGATIQLLLQADSVIVQTKVSDAQGNFIFNNVPNNSFIVTVSNLDYQQFASFVTLNNSSKDLGTLKLMQQGKDLEEVIIIGRAPAAVQIGDTSQFSASQYKVNPDATTEDLIKKMPGVTVDKNGTVTAQGEAVKKVTVDGKEFFGDDASAALKNLPSSVVDKIQVFDKLSDQAQLTGIDDGNSVKTINIVTKSGIKNGQFGRIYAGYGTDERYSAGGNMSLFEGDRRISVVANFNNVNQQNFGSQDLLGLTGSSGGGGGRGGGGSDDFIVGQSNGISKTNALGINYSDKYGKKVELAGSYFFNNSTNNNQSKSTTQILANNQFTNQNSFSVTENTNHRLNLKLEYKIDSNNFISIRPRLNFQNNNANSNGLVNSYKNIADSVYNEAYTRSNDRSAINFSNEINYRHSFAKKGRSINLSLNNSYNKNTGGSYIDAKYRYYYDLGAYSDSIQNQFIDNYTDGTSYRWRLGYSEPLSKNSIIQLSYNYSTQKNSSDQEAYNFGGAKYDQFDTTYSNKFDNTIKTNNIGLAYRWSKGRDAMLNFGVDYENSNLESQRVFPGTSQVDQSFSNFLPYGMYRQKLSKSSNIRVFYRARNNFPSVTQLQDVVNRNNPLRLSAGNPFLKQAYTNFLGTRYTYTNTKTSNSLFANIFLSTTSNYISNAIYIAQADSTIQQGITLKKGSQLTMPVNLDGNKSIRSYLTYSTPLKFIKTTLNLNTGLNYSRLPGLVNYKNTVTNNYNYNVGAVLASNISEYVDFNLNYSANFNKTKSTSANAKINKSVNQSTGLQLNLLSKTGWFVQNSVNNETNTGLSNGFNQNYWLWNAAIGKKFLKNDAGELKLSVFDLLKQNQSISRDVTEIEIRDSQSTVLQQYFMLTFTYSLKNFGTGKAPSQNENGRGGMRGM